MKLIEGLKKIKELLAKADDLRAKVRDNCADMDVQEPVYGSVSQQQEQIKVWLQSHSDVLKEALRLRLSVQRTNLGTKVTIELGGKQVEKTIAEWIHRRKDLAKADGQIWALLTDRGLQPQNFKDKEGQISLTKVRRYFDAKERDTQIELYRTEPGIIDRTLEVVNATTDLME